MASRKEVTYEPLVSLESESKPSTSRNAHPLPFNANILLARESSVDNVSSSNTPPPVSSQPAATTSESWWQRLSNEARSFFSPAPTPVAEPIVDITVGSDEWAETMRKDRIEAQQKEEEEARAERLAEREERRKKREFLVALERVGFGESKELIYGAVTPEDDEDQALL